MTYSYFLAIVFLLGISIGSANAQESSAIMPQSSGSASTINDTTNSISLKNTIFENKKFEEYQGITDPRLRASEGSLSRYSIKADLFYGGPDLSNLSDENRPNPDQLNTPTETNISGRIGARYRLTSQSALNFGTGVKDIYPVQGSYQTDRVSGQERYQVSTPYFGYDYTTRFHDLQTRQSITVTRTTIPNFVRTGQEAGLGYDVNVVREFGHSRYSVGLDASYTNYFFDRPYQPGTGGFLGRGKPPRASGTHALPAFNGDGRASDERFGLSPNLRYTISRKIQASTGFAVTWDHFRYHEGATNLYPETVSENLGISYSFTRDILVLPFLTFYPSRLAPDMTTVNMVGIFSIF